MAQNEFTRNAAPDGIHENIEFNEYRSAEYWTAFWARRVRRKFIMEKLAPFGIVAVAVAAFCIVGIIEKAL